MFQESVVTIAILVEEWLKVCQLLEVVDLWSKYWWLLLDIFFKLDAEFSSFERMNSVTDNNQSTKGVEIIIENTIYI